VIYSNGATVSLSNCYFSNTSVASGGTTGLVLFVNTNIGMCIKAIFKNAYNFYFYVCF
jgi:hypothetical protein